MEMVKAPDFDEAERLVGARYSDKAADIFRERYCLKGETISHAMWRVATTVAGWDEGKALQYFYGLLVPNGFMPNTPTWTGADTRLNQLAACFVLPIEDDMESIFNTLRDAALIQRSGGGVGFNFGHLRPEDALVKSSGGRSSGPISFLTAYDAVFQTIAQGFGHRFTNFTENHPQRLAEGGLHGDTASRPPRHRALHPVQEGGGQDLQLQPQREHHGRLHGIGDIRRHVGPEGPRDWRCRAGDPRGGPVL